MVNHGFYNGKKTKELKNAFLGKILGQISSYYTQIEENINILGVYIYVEVSDPGFI